MTAIEISVRARDTIINYAAIIVRHFVVQTTPHTPSSSSSSSSTIAAASSDINSELGSLTAADRARADGVWFGVWLGGRRIFNYRSKIRRDGLLIFRDEWAGPAASLSLSLSLFDVIQFRV